MDILRANRDIGGERSRARITGRAENLVFAVVVLGKTPGDGMFAPTAADDQNFHIDLKLRFKQKRETTARFPHVRYNFIVA